MLGGVGPRSPTPSSRSRRRRPASGGRLRRGTRVQRWAEDSGNAALMGRELPPAETLAADQRITAWARQLKAADLDGDMDVLRARAYLDLLLGKDFRQATAGGQDDGGTGSPGGTSPGDGGSGPGGGSGPDGRGDPAPGPGASAAPGGLAGKITLTIPLGTLLGLAGLACRDPRPGTRRPLARPRPRQRRREPRRTRVRVHRRRAARATGGIRQLDTPHRRAAGPARRAGPHHHPGLRPPVGQIGRDFHQQRDTPSGGGGVKGLLNCHQHRPEPLGGLQVAQPRGIR